MNLHKPILFVYLFLLLLGNFLTAQEIIVQASFSIRDFKILDNSTLIYIEKRDIKSININTRINDTLIDRKGFFIGGYGLNIYFSKNQKKIITASNELVKNRSSIRFYDIEKKEVNKYKVLYSKSLLDFYAYPKDSLLFLSQKDSIIKLYKYGKTPLYNQIDSIKTNSYARKLKYYNNELYYITDKGTIYKYNIKSRENKILYKGDELFVNFKLDVKREKIYASTKTGEIIIVALEYNTHNKKIKLSNSILEALDLINEDYLIVGDWDGYLKAINLNTYKVRKLYKTKGRIIKIRSKGNYFYTSSSNRKIEKWPIIKF